MATRKPNKRKSPPKTDQGAFAGSKGKTIQTKHSTRPERKKTGNTRKPQLKAVKGAVLNTAEHSRKWYERRLRLLIDVMDGRMKVFFAKKGETLSVTDSDEYAKLRMKFLRLFDKESRPLAVEFFEKNVRYTRAAFRRAVEPILKAQTAKEKDRRRKRMERQQVVNLDAKNEIEVKDFLDGVTENVGLIKSIPDKYFRKIEKAVAKRASGKMTRADLAKRIEEIGGVTHKRAVLIADDQTAKAVNAMTVARCQRAGIKRVMWVHTNLSKEPRTYHKTQWDGHTGKFNGKPNGLNGYIFDINKPPVIDLKTGERGFPAQLINCKCRLAPVVEI